MDEEMKNAEQAANNVENEGASIFDQLKGMLNEATSGEGNVFDKLKGVLEGKEGDPSIFDKTKEEYRARVKIKKLLIPFEQISNTCK